MTIPFANLGMLKDIDVAVSVELGSSSMRLRDICALGEGQVIMLDRLIDEPLDLLVNGKVVARGEVVAEGNRFGLRIIELAGGEAEDAITATPAADGPVGGL
ncbi:flagellar motor switch protein FliN [Aurantiacibacter flavus]|uniref:Flagellar motor switch protein FliN n=1 Tax=Aurantiacibacter flavus TaxID=3145232 RepID=A0ABV0CXG2_9SPHN